MAHDFKYVGGRDRKQADLCEFKVRQSHMVRPCLKKTEGGCRRGGGEDRHRLGLQPQEHLC